MPKVYYSALVNTISGRFATRVYRKIRGINIYQGAPLSAAQPNTARQLQVKANFLTLTSAYPDLPASYRQLWDQFNTLCGMPGTGHNAYIRLNGNLLNASHNDLTTVPHPPHTPATPKHIMGFCVHQVNESTICLSWTKPDDNQTYVTGNFRLHYGFCNQHPCYGLCPTDGYRRSWRFVGTERADQHAIQHVHDWPLDTRLFYRLNSIDTSGRKSPFSHAIETTTKLSQYLWIAEYNGDRIQQRLRANLGYIDKFGTTGSGDDQFAYPFGIAADVTYLYISDSGYDRIKKFRRSDFSFVTKIGTTGAGDDQFDAPRHIDIDDTYLYICDRNNHRIMKRLKSDLSLVTKIGSNGTGDDQFKQPSGMAVDDTHVFVTDAVNGRIFKRKKSDLSYVAKIGSEGDGDDQFNYPFGIAVDDTHLYIADGLNHRIQKRLKLDLSFVAKIGTQGSGDDQFDTPYGIAVNDTYIWIAEGGNHRIQKRLKSDLSFVAKIGTEGTGNDQFKTPTGIYVQQQFG